MPPLLQVLRSDFFAFRLAVSAMSPSPSENSPAQAILREKAAFFDELPADVSPILATANHVCMMQWQTARRFVKRAFEVRHVIQLLDPEADHAD